MQLPEGSTGLFAIEIKEKIRIFRLLAALFEDFVNA